MQCIKIVFKHLVIFFLVTMILLGMLVGSAMIPISAIKENVEKSAYFLCEHELFENIIEGINGSKVDRYADSILLGIAYQYDENMILESVMWSSYYDYAYQNANEDLLSAVSEDLEANQQYLRYWHGSNVVVRPLLILFSIDQIYVLNAIVLLALIVGFVLILIKDRAWVPLAGIIAGLILTNAWVVPFSLEYTWTFILMFCVSIICWKQSNEKKESLFSMCFLVTGMLTNFMDFLTTETLTLLVPVLLLIWKYFQYQKQGSILQFAKSVIQWMVAWALGYVGLWLMKWSIASFVLKENAMTYVAEHMIERTMGGMEHGGIASVIEMIRRNVSCLFPFEYSSIGVIAGVLMWVVVLYIGYVYHKKNLAKDKITLYLMIGMIPFVRYIVLLNHSYLHSFFTYRALFATILSIVMILAEVVEWRWLIHADERKTKS